MNEKAQRVLDAWRHEGLRVAVDFTGRKLDKQIKVAVKKGIEHVIFIGETELAEDRYKLKNLSTGVEETHSRDRIVAILRDHRRKHHAVAEPEEDDDLVA